MKETWLNSCQLKKKSWGFHCNLRNAAAKKAKNIGALLIEVWGTDQRRQWPHGTLNFSDRSWTITLSSSASHILRGTVTNSKVCREQEPEWWAACNQFIDAPRSRKVQEVQEILRRQISAQWKEDFPNNRCFPIMVYFSHKLMSCFSRKMFKLKL